MIYSIRCRICRKEIKHFGSAVFIYPYSNKSAFKNGQCLCRECFTRQWSASNCLWDIWDREPLIAALRRFELPTNPDEYRRYKEAEYEEHQRQEVGDTPREKTEMTLEAFRWGRSFVYIVKKHKGTIYKIGKSNFVRARIKQIENDVGFGVELIKIIGTPSNRMALTLEKALHQRFSHTRIESVECLGREWFELTIEDVEWVKNLPKSMNKVTEYSQIAARK